MVSAPIEASSWVEIEGSGRDVTTISTAPGYGWSYVVGLVAYSELRDLSLVSDSVGTGINCLNGRVRNVSISLSNGAAGQLALTAIHVETSNGLAARMEDVSIVVEQPGVGAALGVFSVNGVLFGRDVTMDIDGGSSFGAGLYAGGTAIFDLQNVRVVSTSTSEVGGVGGFGHVRLRNSYLSAQGAVAYALRSASADVAHSELEASGGSAWSAWMVGGAPGYRIAYSKLAGPLQPPGQGASYRCVGNYDLDLIPVICP